MRFDAELSARMKPGDYEALEAMRVEAIVDGREHEIPQELTDRDALLALVPLGIWDCFCALNRARPVGFAAGGIPPSEFEAWARLHGIEAVETRMRWWELISRMDGEWMAVQAKKG